MLVPSVWSRCRKKQNKKTKTNTTKKSSVRKNNAQHRFLQQRGLTLPIDSTFLFGWYEVEWSFLFWYYSKCHTIIVCVLISYIYIESQSSSSSSKLNYISFGYYSIRGLSVLSLTTFYVVTSQKHLGNWIYTVLCLSDVEKGERAVSFQTWAHVQFCFMIGFSPLTLKYSSSLERRKR